MTDRTFMPSSINGQNILKKSENLDFYATLGENNEGCQELSYSATYHKKCTIQLYSGTIQALQHN